MVHRDGPLLGIERIIDPERFPLFKVGKPGSYRVTAVLDGRFRATSRALRTRR